MRLEAAFWSILDEIAADQDVSTSVFLSTLHREVLELSGEPVNFTSLLRCSLPRLSGKAAGGEGE